MVCKLNRSLNTLLANHIKLSKEQSPKTAQERKDMTLVLYASAVGSWMYAIVILQGFVVDDLCRDVDSRKSTFGYIYTIGGTEVEIDVLTGETTILQSDIIYDCGQSLNPAVDMGQIEGAFVHGIGFFMREEYITNEDGLMVSNSNWMYKIPTIPQNFNVQVLNSGHHKKRVLSSKTSGESPLLLAALVHCATRAAIKATREQLQPWGKLDESISEFYLEVPVILPVVKTHCGLDYVGKFLETLLAQKSS
ncbi:Indole-3-acetaldehyde oxidase [Capsicum baccatum]|uniref:Indole-3-acetaldehyde oxidase n=1 Tax=Capsicum baccatum TaxID=33114 RepID=A0A2G2VPH8_CAPBA|nr:Indole-3-acetaldehyde oxidase [Capsicum baccatum]